MIIIYSFHHLCSSIIKPFIMESTDVILQEESLDPANWEELRQLGHKMVDDMMEYLQTTREKPVWKKPSDNAVKSMHQPLPQKPQHTEAVYEDFITQVLPYNVNNIHPRFWAWVQGGGTPTGMLADMLASGMNTNVSIGDHMPMHVEKQVLDWSKELFGFPVTASGILTSGASIANITALVVARNHFSSQVKQKGLHAVPGQMMIYGSSETHNCLIKGVEVIGIGSDHFRKVSVDRNYRVRIDAMREMISEDRKAGHSPFCIIGNAGTVNTGAIDDLTALAKLANEENLWFHIDGAFGAIPKILPEFTEQLEGIEAADSLTFDFHKWFYMNYEVGCVLIKNAEAHRTAFTSPVNYLLQHEKGLSGGPESFSNYGMELSRGFKALKVWMLLKEHGMQKYARIVRQNITQAKYLGVLVTGNKDLELLAAVSLNIVCYRYNPGNLSEQGLNILNKKILMRLHTDGIAAPSYTMLNGKYCIRVAITNHRSRIEDFDVLIEATISLGRELK
jgi:aromatic-L-amino-acid decarboxylase